MFLTCKEDKTTGSLLLHHLLCVLSMIKVSHYICISMCIYTFMVCADGINTCMCLCVPLTSSSVTCHWDTVFVDVMFT